MKKTRFYEAIDDGSYSHVEPVYLYDVGDVGAGYFRKYSDAKKEIYEKLRRLAEDYRVAAASIRSYSKSEMLEEWDEYAKKRAGLKMKRTLPSCSHEKASNSSRSCPECGQLLI